MAQASELDGQRKLALQLSKKEIKNRNSVFWVVVKKTCFYLLKLHFFEK